MKNTILTGMSLLMVVGSGLADQGAVVTYDTVRVQYEANQPISDISAAITAVEQHLKGLKSQRSVYAPRALNVLGTGLGLVAGIGLIGSIGGALRMYSILNSPENSLASLNSMSLLPELWHEKVMEYGDEIPSQRGLSYLELIEEFYLGVRQPIEKSKIVDIYFNKYLAEAHSVDAAFTIIGGAAAPVAIPVSLIIAGLSKYLFNKAASYHNSDLEALIAQDEKMLIDLKAMQK